MNSSLVRKIALCTLIAAVPAGRAKAFDLQLTGIYSLVALGLGDGAYHAYKGSTFTKAVTALTALSATALSYSLTREPSQTFKKNVETLVDILKNYGATFAGLNGIRFLSDQTCKGAVKIYEKITAKAADDFDDDEEETTEKS